MQSITITQITENLRSLPADKLAVVYDFISFLATREKGQLSHEPVSNDASDTVLLPRTEYERLLARRRRQAAFHDFAHNLGRTVEAQGLDEEEFMADLEKTKREVFAERYGRPA